MSRLAIIATIEIPPGRREEFLPHLMAHRARSLKDEPGTLQFEVMASRENEKNVLLYEAYRVCPRFDVHFNGPSNPRLCR